VSKTMNTKATKFCERIFLDGTGPFAKTISGNHYWYQIVDDLTRKGWTHFQAKKSKLNEKMEQFVIAQKANGNIIKYLHCDAAGENEVLLKMMCERHGIILEKTVPDIPQQNGVVERRVPDPTPPRPTLFRHHQKNTK
jgi:hypothetical protein